MDAKEDAGVPLTPILLGVYVLENLDGATREAIANLKLLLEDKTKLEAMIGSVSNRETSALVFGLWVRDAASTAYIRGQI